MVYLGVVLRFMMTFQIICALFSSFLLSFLCPGCFLYQFVLSSWDMLYFCSFLCIWTWELQMRTAFPMCTCMAKHRCALFDVIKCSGIPFGNICLVKVLDLPFNICIGPKCAETLLHI